MKSQGSGASTPKTLQSQTRHSAENRFSINGSAIVHGRLFMNFNLRQNDPKRAAAELARLDHAARERGVVANTMRLRALRLARELYHGSQTSGDRRSGN
jgi:hypothetical protein